MIESRSPRIVVVGSTMIDLIVRVERMPRLGETLAGRSFAMAFGGKGGNQAVMAARLGADVTLVSRVGGDAFGSDALANYRSAGLDLRHVRRDAARTTGTASIFVDDGAHNCIVIVPAANAALDDRDVAAAADAIASADVVVCQLEVPIPTVIAAFALARRAGARTILNPAPAAAIPAELWQLTDCVVPNETEAEVLTGITVASDRDAQRAAATLRAYGPPTVVITLGERGALVHEAHGSIGVAARAVAAVDPTGAGDAFVGTLAVELARGCDLADAARRATVVASLSVTRPGAQASFPDRAAVDAALASADT